MKRSRGRGRRQGNSANRSYESNGPDVKVRGTANTICEKYQSLAQDALSSGELINAENYLQHAEHYYRIVQATQPNKTEETVAEESETAGAANGTHAANGTSAASGSNAASTAAAGTPSFAGDGDAVEPLVLGRMDEATGDADNGAYEAASGERSNRRRGPLRRRRRDDQDGQSAKSDKSGKSGNGAETAKQENDATPETNTQATSEATTESGAESGDSISDEAASV